MNEPVTVRRFQSTIEAEIAGGALEAAGIPAFIQADDAGGMRPHLQQHGVALRVAPEHADEAIRLLAEIEKRAR
jgi:hypothetical protein